MIEPMFRQFARRQAADGDAEPKQALLKVTRFLSQNSNVQCSDPILAADTLWDFLSRLSHRTNVSLHLSRH